MKIKQPRQYRLSKAQALLRVRAPTLTLFSLLLYKKPNLLPVNKFLLKHNIENFEVDQNVKK